MANQLVINPRIQRMVTALEHTLPHALLAVGKPGVGAGTIARMLAEKHTAHAYIVSPEYDGKADAAKGSISVDAVRRLIDQLKTKATSARVVIIDGGERMTQAAQNALLKLLEEPGLRTHIIIVCHDQQAMLATIVSRAQLLAVPPATRAQSEALLDTLGVTDATKRQQLLFVGAGLPALLTTLANDEAAFAVRAASLRDARTLLQGTPYERLVLTQRYASDRPQAMQLVDDAISLLQFSLTGKTILETHVAINLEKLLTCRTALAANGHVRLALLAAVL